jgi:predicted component of type VI protein secretion system
MGLMSKIEATLSGVMEGAFGWLFRTRLEPVELARKLERAMSANTSVGVGADRRIAPNVYDVYLSPRDYARFEQHVRTLTQRLSDRLIASAKENGITMTTRPLVRLHEASDIVTGQARISTQLLDPQTLAAAAPPDETGSLDSTRTISPDETAELNDQLRAYDETNSLPPAWLTLVRPTRGQPIRLERQTVRIGRNLSNEVIVNDPKVSRFHAQIRYENGQFVVYDVSSTNGVRINGVRAQRPVPLRPNDTLGVGSHEFIFQRR